MPGPETFPKPQAQLSLPSCPLLDSLPVLGGWAIQGWIPRTRAPLPYRGPAHAWSPACFMQSLSQVCPFGIALANSCHHGLQPIHRDLKENSSHVRPQGGASPPALHSYQQLCGKGTDFGRVTAGRWLWSIFPLCLCSVERDHVVPG